MKKKILVGLAIMLGTAHEAGATLTTIGTASYKGGSYNLIWDANNGQGQQVVWLDYTNDYAKSNWWSQKLWAAGLNTIGTLTYNLKPGYSVTWEGDWRLPTTVDGTYNFGHDGTTTAGYNITNSEWGHLYYTELENKGILNTDGSNNFDEYYANGNTLFTNVGDFQRLIVRGAYYWSGTEYSTNMDRAWAFLMEYGTQTTNNSFSDNYGLAIRSGQVTFNDPNGGGTTPVPEPSTMLLMGTGLTSLVATRRKKKA